MASLWSLIKSRHRIEVKYSADTFSRDEITRLMSTWSENRAVLVNITDYQESWVNDQHSEFSLGNMDATPGFRFMWFEWTRKELQREAVIVSRLSPMASSETGLEKARFMLQMLMIHEINGGIMFRAGTAFHIDQMGCLVGTVRTVGDLDHEEQGFVMARVLLVCDALTSMNTHGTRIEPPFDSPGAQIIKPNRAPCSVWHTIHIPKFPHPPLAGAEITPEVLERREHWVRAHRRDYRRGAGMFGRIKALVWVPEFQRGNPELGTVKQSYAVARTS